MKKAIAIIGGMGPEASAYLYTTLIKNSVSHFQAVNNDDFPEIVLYSVPVPDFISSSEKEMKATEMLKQKVLNINKLDVLCGALACNTAHKVLDELQNAASFPFVSMINEVVTEVKNDSIKTVGLLGTPSTIKSEMYQDALKQNGISTIIPLERDYTNIDNAIRNVISDSRTPEDKQNLIRIADYLKDKGAEGIILGCTEIPLVFPTRYSLPIYNSVEILSLALLKKYYN